MHTNCNSDLHSLGEIDLHIASPGYPTPWIPYPQYPLTLNPIPWVCPQEWTWYHGYTSPWKGPGTKDTLERTWYQGYPTPVDIMTDICENITFPQLHWRSVTHPNGRIQRSNSSERMCGLLRKLTQTCQYYKDLGETFNVKS